MFGIMDKYNQFAIVNRCGGGGGGGSGGGGSSRPSRNLGREGAAVGAFVGNVGAGLATRGNSVARAAGSSGGGYLGYEAGSRINRDQAAHAGRGMAEVVGRGVMSGNFGAAMR